MIANAGLPMIFWQLPAMLCALPIVITVEMAIGKYGFQIPWRQNFKSVAIANAVSTIVGIPLAWITMLAFALLTTGGYAGGLNTPYGVFQSIVLQASWLVPYREALYWMIPSATLVLLVPYFFATLYSERITLEYVWRDHSNTDIRRFTWYGNLTTYGILFSLTCGWLLLALITG